jgi:hypothetical protein
MKEIGMIGIEDEREAERQAENATDLREISAE